MPNQTTQFRLFTDLTNSEKAILRKLTSNTERTEMKRLLDDPNQKDKYATIVTRDDKVIGWAAANTKHYTDSGIICAYVHSDYRRQGVAKEALDQLLANITELNVAPLFGFSYDRRKENLFLPSLEKHIYSVRKSSLVFPFKTATN